MSNDVLSDVPPRRSPLATVYDYVRGQSLVVGPGRRTVPALVRAVSSLYKHRMAHIVPTNRGIIYMLSQSFGRSGSQMMSVCSVVILDLSTTAG